jgi:UDP-N-acetylmuramoyl-tripeptide--D-alanyl-D-alanine ligase
MIRERLVNAAAWMGGSLLGNDAAFDGVSTDSRSVSADALFFALRGEHADGHAYLADAARRGAIAAVVQRPQDELGIAQIVVADTLLALAELARQWRQRLPARVVAVTGSNGKTTTKTLIGSILALAGRSAATPGNFNNEIGLPLSVLALDREVDYAVLEMGCGKPGDIRYLVRIGLPDVAIVTNVGPAHLERLGSVEGVARTKAEIYEGLARDGVGVLNADDPFAPYFRQVLGLRTRIEFGLDSPCAVTATELAMGERSGFTLVTPAGQIAVELALPGRHNVMNALAAAAAAHALEIPLGTIKRGLESAPDVGGRLTRYASPHGWVLFDDSYNANPASVLAGIATVLAGAGNGEAWLALGDMKELGSRQTALHADVGRQAREMGIARMFTVGPLAEHAAAAFGPQAQSYPDRASLASDLSSALARGVHVLVKGSRSSGMERVVGAVLEAHGMHAQESHHAA